MNDELTIKYGDLWVRLLGVVLLLVVPVVSYWFGTRQRIAADREKAKMDAANAQKLAEASKDQADAAQQNSDVGWIRQAGVDSLKTLIDSSKAISDLTQKVHEQGEQLGKFKYDQAVKIGELELKHQIEISQLETKIRGLETDLQQLRDEAARKDRDLAECAKVRQEKAEQDTLIVSLRAEIEELERAKSAFLFLWTSASENKGDTAQVNLAEEAIRRVTDRADRPKSIPPPSPPPDDRPQEEP